MTPAVLLALALFSADPNFKDADIHVEFLSPKKKTMTGPVFLQDHGNPVKFRNVWVLPADENVFTYAPEGK